MSDEMTAAQHAQRFAVLDVIADEVNSVRQAEREAAGPAFAEWRKSAARGGLKAALPDGTDIGLVSVKAGGKTVTVDEKALDKWVRDHLPDGLEDYTEAITDPEVLDVLRAVFPHLVQSRIRQATRTALLREISDRGGYLVDKSSGEATKVAAVEVADPTGAFAFRAAPEARENVMAAWRRGELRDIALGGLALPAGGDTDA